MKDSIGTNLENLQFYKVYNAQEKEKSILPQLSFPNSQFISSLGMEQGMNESFYAPSIPLSCSSLPQFHPHFVEFESEQQYSYPPSTFYNNQNRYRSNSYSNSSTSSNNSSYLGPSTPMTPNSTKQIHCSVFDCFRLAFCTLEPCSCTLCNDHFGSVIRSGKLVKEAQVSQEGKESIKNDGKDQKEKIFTCLGCGIESIENLSKAREELNSIESQVNKDRQDEQEEGVNRFAVHFLPSATLPPLPTFDVPYLYAEPQSFVSNELEYDYNYQPQYPTFSTLVDENFISPAPNFPILDPSQDNLNLIHPHHYFPPQFPPSSPFISSPPILQPYHRSNRMNTRKNRSYSLPISSNRNTLPPFSNLHYSWNQENKVPKSSPLQQQYQNSIALPPHLFLNTQTPPPVLLPYHRPNVINRSQSNQISNNNSLPSQQASYDRSASVNLSSNVQPFNANHRETIEFDELESPKVIENNELLKREIIKVENIPFGTTVADIEIWLDNDCLPSLEDVISPIHLILHRQTARTLPHCFIEIKSHEIAACILKDKDKSSLGDRTVRVKWERKDEMLRDLFSQSEYFKNVSGSILTLAACPLPKLSPKFELTGELITDKDIESILEFCRDSVKCRPVERAFLNIITIILKFPWSESNCENQRDVLFNLAFDAIKIAAQKSTDSPVYFTFIDKLISTVLKCSHFTTEQKKIVKDFDPKLYLKLPIVTPVTSSLPSSSLPTASYPNQSSLPQRPVHTYIPVHNRYSFKNQNRNFISPQNHEGAQIKFKSFDKFNHRQPTSFNQKTFSHSKNHNVNTGSNYVPPKLTFTNSTSTLATFKFPPVSPSKIQELKK